MTLGHPVYPVMKYKFRRGKSQYGRVKSSSVYFFLTDSSAFWLLRGCVGRGHREALPSLCAASVATCNTGQFEGRS